jgi:hypothetical protein
MQLPETHADRLHLECFLSDGGSYCIETKRCRAVQVCDDVVDVAVTPIVNGKAGRTSRHGPGAMKLEHAAAATVV